MSAAMRFFSKGFKNEFETAVVNEPSVFEPLKFYCILLIFENIYILTLFTEKPCIVNHWNVMFCI